jgi:hypothetical protein
MAPRRGLSRRNVLYLMGSAAALGATEARAASAPAVQVWKDPNCGCCRGWVEHLSRSGFAVASVDTSDLASIKAEAGIPADLASCHTARIEGYVLEGHVPAAAIRRLLNERPEGIGLAVPGMPIGSPGMEGGSPEVYAVILFGATERRVFARFIGAEPVTGDVR